MRKEMNVTLEKLKAGIIGCGNISAIYLENLKNSPLIEIVAVADLIRERAQERQMNLISQTFTM